MKVRLLINNRACTSIWHTRVHHYKEFYKALGILSSTLYSRIGEFDFWCQKSIQISKYCFFIFWSHNSNLIWIQFNALTRLKRWLLNLNVFYDEAELLDFLAHKEKTLIKTYFQKLKCWWLLFARSTLQLHIHIMFYKKQFFLPVRILKNTLSMYGFVRNGWIFSALRHYWKIFPFSLELRKILFEYCFLLNNKINRKLFDISFID